MNLKNILKTVGGIFLFALLLTPKLAAADGDLVALVTTARPDAEVESRMADPDQAAGMADGEFPLKEFPAFGTQFAGKVIRKDHAVSSILLWCVDTQLSPAAASAIFVKVQGAINGALGAGRTITDIPNFEDASDAESHGKAWAVSERDTVILTTDNYFNRANLSVVRHVDSRWLEELGDATEFWRERLDGLTVSAGNASSRPSGRSSVDAQGNPVGQRAQPVPTAEVATGSVWKDRLGGWWWVPVVLLILIGIRFYLAKRAGSNSGR